MTTDTRDPVAALARATALMFSEHGELDIPLYSDFAPGQIEHLAEQGYVLVNAEGLAAALEAIDEDWPEERAAAMLAAIQEQQQ